MSRDSGRHSTTANTALFVTAAVIIFCIAGAIGVAAFVEDPDARIGLVVIMLSQIPVTAGLLRVLVVADKVDSKAQTIEDKAQTIEDNTQNIEDKTDRVLNGDMDKKIREAIRSVVEERWGKPDSRTRPVNEPKSKP